MKFTTAKQTEEAAYNAVGAFTRIHGRPNRRQYRRFRKDVLAALVAVDVPGEDYGLLGELTGDEEFTRITGKAEYEFHPDPSEIATYNPDIDGTEDDEERRRLEAEHLEFRQAAHVRKGALRAICHHFREALDEKHYQDLEEPVIGYKKVTIRDHFEHLESRYCKLDTKVRQEEKKHYLRGWQIAEDESIRQFAKRLTTEQKELTNDGIEITDTEKLQHYREQMYESANFSAADHRAYEGQAEEDKTWQNTTEYFEKVTDSIDTHRQCAGDGAKEAGFESAAAIKEEAKREALEEMRRELAREREANSHGDLLQFLQEQAAQQHQQSTPTVGTEAVQAIANGQAAFAASQAEMARTMAAMQQQMTAMSKKLALVGQQQPARPAKAPTAPEPAPPAAKPPPGFSAAAAGADAAKWTGHALNSAGKACPTRISRAGDVVFVNRQLCDHCGKEHFALPDDCYALPKNAEKKRARQAASRKRPRAKADE